MSVAHSTVQVEPPVQLRLQDEVQANAQVEPDAQVALPLSPIVTSQTAPLEQV